MNKQDKVQFTAENYILFCVCVGSYQQQRQWQLQEEEEEEMLLQAGLVLQQGYIPGEYHTN